MGLKFTGNSKLVSAVATTLNATGADVLFGRHFKGRGSIFVLHSVASDRGYYLNDRLHASALFLDQLLAHYHQRGIDIVSLTEALERLKNGSSRYFVCFTFDDGYRDNLTIALPLFQKYNAPFTVYITTAFINRTYYCWWRGLQEVIKKTDELFLESFDERFDVSTAERKIKAYRVISSAVITDDDALASLQDMFRRHDVHIEDLLDQDALSEEELRVLSRSPLVEIGAHTHTHLKLSQVPLEDAKRDILDNKEYLERLTDREIIHFAYPYGDQSSCGQREFNLVKELRFRTATTTHIGALFPEHLKRTTALPRFRLFNEVGNIRLIEFQRNGGMEFMMSLLRRGTQHN